MWLMHVSCSLDLKKRRKIWEIKSLTSGNLERVTKKCLVLWYRVIIYRLIRIHLIVVNLPRSGLPTKITPKGYWRLFQEATKETRISKALQASLTTIKSRNSTIRKRDWVKLRPWETSKVKATANQKEHLILVIFGKYSVDNSWTFWNVNLESYEIYCKK